MAEFDYKKYKERQNAFELVFEALQEHDFNKAASLAPEGYKLCGYQEFSESFVYEQYGYGWAGQFEYTKVQSGLYPVFCCEYFYNEVEHSFTNSIKDYPGICLWYKGVVVSSSVSSNVEQPNTVFAHPYAHSIAHDIIKSESRVNLLPPFKAVEIPFERKDEILVTYKIIDTSIPPLSKKDPMKLGHSNTISSLEEQIKKSQESVQHNHPSSISKKKIHSIDINVNR